MSCLSAISIQSYRFAMQNHNATVIEKKLNGHILIFSALVLAVLSVGVMFLYKSRFRNLPETLSPITNTNSLIGKWEVVSVQKDDTVIITEGNGSTVEFLEDGTYQALGGCNEMIQSKYEVGPEGKISFKVGGTKRSCEGSVVEFWDLNGAYAYKLANSTLFLYYKTQNGREDSFRLSRVKSDSSINPTSDWKTYINKEYGFKFEYPLDVTFKETPLSVSFTRTFTFNHENINYNNFFFRIYTMKKAKEESLDAFLLKPCDERQGPDFVDNNKASEECRNHFLQTKKYITIDGVSSIQAERLYYEGSSLETLIPHNNVVIVFSLGEATLGSGFSDESKETLNQILSTFRFDDSAEKNMSCRPIFFVEQNMPELTASQSYSMVCYKQKTKPTCLAVDIYNEKLDSFGEVDGIPDCKWESKLEDER